MKKIYKLLSLITIAILLASCGAVSDYLSDEKYGDWTTPSS
jgi:hypothetical protein